MILCAFHHIGIKIQDELGNIFIYIGNLMELQVTNCLRHNRTNEMFCQTCHRYICTECLSDHDADGHEGEYVHILKYSPEKILPVIDSLIKSSGERQKAAENDSAEIVILLQNSLPKLLGIVEAHSRRIEDLKNTLSRLKKFSKTNLKAASAANVMKGIELDRERLEKAIKEKKTEEALKLSLKTEAEAELSKSHQSISVLVENFQKAMENLEKNGGYEHVSEAVGKMVTKCNSLRLVQYVNDWKCDRNYLTHKMYLSADGLTFGNTASSGYPAIIGNVPFDTSLYAFEVIPSSLDCSGNEGFGIIEKEAYLNAHRNDPTTPTVYNDMIGFLYPNHAKNMTAIRMSDMEMDRKYYIKVNMIELAMILFGPGVLFKASLEPNKVYYPCFSCGCSNNRLKIRPLDSFDEVEDPEDAWIQFLAFNITYVIEINACVMQQTTKRYKGEQKMSVLGVEPRFSEPQSEVLTTRRYRHVNIFCHPFFILHCMLISALLLSSSLYIYQI
eukprot:TRINITY_DN480_c0_g2_i2.p2 TRINITY_DN480_c0_g2~~TRINITY_DN480_c0_g2_i2.p2  ORF type:complete len:501 (-),score=38.85 TRINITY_DN480_c0_g2_i2:993-2495(-)